MSKSVSSAPRTSAQVRGVDPYAGVQCDPSGQPYSIQPGDTLGAGPSPAGAELTWRMHELFNSLLASGLAISSLIGMVGIALYRSGDVTWALLGLPVAVAFLVAAVASARSYERKYGADAASLARRMFHPLGIFRSRR